MTPASDPVVLRRVAEDETLRQLEFERVLGIVAECAISKPGHQSIMRRRPISDPEAIQHDLSLANALRAILDDGDRFCPANLPDLRPLVESLRVSGSVLEGSELVELAGTTVAIAEMQDEVNRLCELDPTLHTLRCAAPPRGPAEQILKAIEPNGTLRDSASPELRRARKAVRDARERLVNTLESMVRELSERDRGTDAKVTMRDGRYVIPVRRESRGRVQGIVHGESGSGATLFVEPTGAVDLGNDLSIGLAAERREEIRVLRSFTELLRGDVDVLADAWAACVHVDDVYARARYALTCKAQCPVLGDRSEGVLLTNAFHPVLLADLPSVVPFDLALDPDTAAVVISGPNTGGKTVLLKTVGLAAALVQSGIIPPVRGPSRIPIFEHIFSDIGDRQSIADNLSTFSAHLTSLRDMLRVVTPTTLVLLDEFGTGTDPVEGAALAGAVLEALCQRRCVALATTHLGQIKQLAVETPGAENASLQFDPHRLEPTYRFQLGVPGRSYGLAIAQRLGFAEDVLARATELLPDGERSVDALLADLEKREHDLTDRESTIEHRLAVLEAERDGLEALRSDLTQRADQLKHEQQQMESNGRAEARRFLLDARRRVEEALGLARGAVNTETAKAARRVVEEAVQQEGDALQRLQDEARKKGWTVRGSVGTANQEEVADPVSKPRRMRRRQTSTLVEEPASVTEVDLRGMTADEAESAVLRAIDAAVVEDVPNLRVIHGKGTGALRQRTLQVLKRERRVKSFRQGSPTEGGWGVTVADFRQ